MLHPKSIEWDKKLKEICDQIDLWLEEQYGALYTLRPNRPLNGETSNPEMDGLFNVQAVFTPGYRSDTGRGYLIEIELSTLEKVDLELKRDILDQVLVKLEEAIKNEFPERLLEIGFDGNMIKIWGDLNLGFA
jgi:hypothetical protein